MNQPFDMGRFKILKVGPAQLMPVTASDYPWISEWDWQYDEKTDLAYRVEGDRRVFLYHEILKRVVEDPQKSMPVVGRATIRALFMPHQSYAAALADIRVRRVMADTQGWILPGVNEFLRVALSMSLMRVFLWRKYTGSTESFDNLRQFWDVKISKENQTVPMMMVAALDMWSTWNQLLSEENEKLDSVDLVKEFFDKQNMPLEMLLMYLTRTVGTYPYVP